jgi:predicted  nucleic acid-binding Zn-ribbon protein
MPSETSGLEALVSCYRDASPKLLTMSLLASTIRSGMSLAGQLYKLQQLDLELQDRQQELDDVENKLSDNEALLAMETKLASQREQLEDARKKQKSCEWELDDLQEKIKRVNGKLYGGKTKDPKELVNLEKEVKALRSQIKAREDSLLGLMGEVEQIEAGVKGTVEESERLKREWGQTQETLGPRKSDLEIELAGLKGQRSELARQIESEALSVYERIRPARGQAVVKVERGRCLGCHIAVPTSQWQKAKAGDLIQCNNCSRILYLE